MAKTLFRMKFGGYGNGKSKATGKDFYTIKLLEEVETYDRTRKELSLTILYPDALPADISSYKLYDDVLVALDVTAGGQKPRFLSIEPYKEGII